MRVTERRHTHAYAGAYACMGVYTSVHACMHEVSRIRVGKKQTIESLINEEALLLAKFLRGERRIWTPRIIGDFL